MKKTIFTLMIIALARTTAVAQSMLVVGGSVTDAATGQPLAGVYVEAYGGNRFTAMTDENGHYEFEVPRYVTSLAMRVDGYQMVQTPIGRRPLQTDAALYADTFSPIYEPSTTGAQQHSASGFDRVSDLSVDPLVAQRLGAEVRSVSRGGNAGLGCMMLVGGINSLQAGAQPLIVIDGVITDMQYDRTMLHDGYFNNLLANVNVNDIERVTVLKNGTALYGAKGANGVLLVETKRNKSMATKIDLTVNGRFELTPRLPRMLGADDYRLYATELLADQTADVSKLKFAVSDPTYYYYRQYHNETDWTDEAYREAFSTNYGINVQGGDDVANYNLSVGYSIANSTLKRNDFTRFDMRLNTDIVVFPRLKARFDASYSDVNRNLRDDGAPASASQMATSPGFLALVKSPFLSPYAYDLNGRLSHYLSEADDYLSEVYGSDASLANPNSILEYGEGKNRNQQGNRMISFSLTPRYEFNRHLSLSEHFNFSLVNTNENYYLPMSGVPAFKVEDLSESYVNNQARSLAARQNAIQSDTRLTWQNVYGAHSLDVLGGLRYLSQSYKLTTQEGYNTGNDKTPNMSTSLSFKNTGGADDASRSLTWYAQANYDWAGKYYLTAGLSAEASSRFGADAGGLKLFDVVWGLFPSIDAAWVVSNEKWMAGVPGVDYLRLYAGYDVAGNDNIDYTASRTYFVANRMLGSSVDGKSLGNIGNTALKWETTRRLTAGLNANFLANRLNMRLQYFKSWTSDLLTQRQLAWTSGLSTGWANDGKLQNEGFDVELGLKVLALRNLQWEVGASMGHYVNRLTQLPAGRSDAKPFETEAYSATIRSAVGHPVGVFYGYKTEGVFTTQADADAAGLYLVDERGARHDFAAGDMHFSDLDGNHQIDEADRVVIGNPNPDIYGNIYTRLAWKRWTLDAVANYVLGNDIYNYERSLLEGGSRFFNQTTAMSARWTAEGQPSGVPRIAYGDPMGNARFCDRWIEDGSYLRLSNVRLSYELPIQSTYLQGITLWVSAQNVFTLTRYLGSDPDLGGASNVLWQGIDRGLLAQGRAFTAGVKINL